MVSYTGNTFSADRQLQTNRHGRWTYLVPSFSSVNLTDIMSLLIDSLITICNVSTIGLCGFMKVPQIIAIIKAKSTKGLSLTSLMLELTRWVLFAVVNVLLVSCRRCLLLCCTACSVVLDILSVPSAVVVAPCCVLLVSCYLVVTALLSMSGSPILYTYIHNHHLTDAQSHKYRKYVNILLIAFSKSYSPRVTHLILCVRKL